MLVDKFVRKYVKDNILTLKQIVSTLPKCISDYLALLRIKTSGNHGNRASEENFEIADCFYLLYQLSNLACASTVNKMNST